MSTTTTHPERRVRGLFLGILVILSIFAAQLVRLQGFDAGGLAAKGERQRLVDVVVPASRGVITDSAGVVLADSVERYTLVADQEAVAQYKKKVDGALRNVGAKGAAADIAPILQLSEPDVEGKLTGTKRYIRVATDVTPMAWRAISKLGIGGLSVERTVKRTYPQGPAAATIVGFLDNQGSPAAGVEQMLDSSLKGTDGKQSYEQTPTGQRIPTADGAYVAPVPGKGVRLTIDSDVQWFVQNALAQLVPKVQALSASAVVQEVSTGRLLAVGNYPTFDPSDLTSLSNGGSSANLAFQEVYEPGSTAKVVTMGSALQEKVVTPSTPVTVPNRLKRSDKVFRDAEEHGVESLTATGVLAQSSNIGTILIGEKMPARTNLDYLSKFGLGHPTGIGFPGESPGIMPKQLSGSQRYTILFGQGLSVNAVQQTGVFQAVANGGRRIAPTLVEGTTDGNGTFTPSPAPASSQVLSPEVAAQLTTMMEQVVSGHGTAQLAEIPGYAVAGKTGTANRYDSKTHGYNGYTASFIGFAPADHPRFVVSVTVQRPLAGTFGGTVAAPVFAQIMKYLLEKYQVPPSGATQGSTSATPSASPSASTSEAATPGASATPGATAATSDAATLAPDDTASGAASGTAGASGSPSDDASSGDGATPGASGSDTAAR